MSRADARPSRAGTDAVAIVDAQGLLIWWSAPVASALARAGVEWTSGMTCCEALECAANTTPEERCLTHCALGSSEGLSARPWRVGSGERRLEAALSVRPIVRGTTTLVVFELSFAPLNVSNPTGPVVEVSALGRLSVSVGGHNCDGDWQQQRPGEVFRYLLASRSAAQRSEAIAGALWPDRGPSAVANVRNCI